MSELTKEQKQRNFFQSIVMVSKKEKIKYFYGKEGEEQYKEVVLNLPIEAIEEIEKWANEVKE